MLNSICTLANCTLAYWWPKPTPSLTAAMNSVSSLAQVVAFDSGCDIYASPVLFVSPRRALFRSTNAFRTYSYRIVALRATVPKVTLSSTLWRWLEPFTPQLWGLLAGTIMFGAAIFLILEAESTSEESIVHVYTKTRIPRTHAVVQSMFLAVCSLTTVMDHDPTLFASRIFICVKAFTTWIVMAAYLANFAARLATRPVAVQDITSWDVFAQRGWQLCVANNSIGPPTMAGFYPTVPVKLISFASTLDMVKAVASGTCKAAVAQDAELQTVFSQDVAGAYCSVDYVAQPSYFTFASALAVTPNTAQLPQAALNDINLAIDIIYFSGASLSDSAVRSLVLTLSFYRQLQVCEMPVHAIFFALTCFLPSTAESALLNVTRPMSYCADYMADVGSTLDGFAPLGVVDLAGLFIVQAGAATAALLFHFAKLGARAYKARKRMKKMSAGGGSEADAAATVDADASDLSQNPKLANFVEP
jgi:hypothetical protein